LDTANKKHLLYLFALTLLLFFPGLGTRDLWAPVEPRYGEIARVMFAKGEWVVPTVNGDLYTDKPILYFWLVLIASTVAGAVNEWTIRLPVAVGATGFVLATYFFGRDFFGARIGLLAATMLATSARVIWEARWAHVDAIFSFFFVLSVYYAVRAFLAKGSSYEILFAYVFMGLATLSKGLIGIVLPGLLLVSFMAVRRDWRMIAAAKLHLGIPIFLLVVAPWLDLVSSATDGKWLSDFIYIHHLHRYTAGVGHHEPFYYYFRTLPVDFLPWTIFALPALFAYRQHHRLFKEPAKLFLALWFLVVFVFFSASATKRDLYLMPLLPVVALFIAHYMDHVAADRLPQGALYRSVTLIFFAVIALEGLALPLLAWLLRREVFLISLPAAGVLATGGAVAIYFIKQKKPLKLVAATTVMMVLTMLCAVISIFPYVDRFKSHRFFAIEVQRVVPASATVYLYADTMDNFNYYMQREVMPVVRSRAQVETLLREGEEAYMLVNSTDLKRLGVIAPQRIRITGAVGDTVWNLIALGGSSAKK
jgi:4-amino-4-deoxy-L-arabinose transferase-like glycosyltransferase